MTTKRARTCVVSLSLLRPPANFDLFSRFRKKKVFCARFVFVPSASRRKSVVAVTLEQQAGRREGKIGFGKRKEKKTPPPHLNPVTPERRCARSRSNSCVSAPPPPPAIAKHQHARQGREAYKRGGLQSTKEPERYKITPSIKSGDISVASPDRRTRAPAEGTTCPLVS